MAIARSTRVLEYRKLLWRELQCRNDPLAVGAVCSITRCRGYDNRTAFRSYSQSPSGGKTLSDSSGNVANGVGGRQSDDGPTVTADRSTSTDSTSESISPHGAKDIAKAIESSDNGSSSISSESEISQERNFPARISPEQFDTISQSLEKAVQSTQEIRSLMKPRIIASVTAQKVRRLLELLFSSPHPTQRRVLPTYNALERKDILSKSSETDLDDESYFPELETMQKDKRADEETPHLQNESVTRSTPVRYGFMEPDSKASAETDMNQTTRTLLVDLSVPTLRKTDFVRLLGIDPGRGTEHQRKRARDFLEYIDFEFRPKRDENLHQRKGYYLQFKSVEAAQLYQRRTGSVMLYGKQMKDRTRTVGIGRPGFRLKMFEDTAGCGSHCKYVLLHDLPLSVTRELVEQRLSEFVLEGEPSGAIRRLPSQIPRSRYLVRLASEDEALKVVLELQGKPWFENGSEGIFAEIIA
ncbi:hypothetical protein V1517DRAFT_309728 [Lipomyces orientalis]|uniref:Uncharacterized protein n=1 Tax=Lipomyces orientalis TaxID=1233043 RepID=A0ACC3TKB2_9ASCO